MRVVINGVPVRGGVPKALQEGGIPFPPAFLFLSTIGRKRNDREFGTFFERFPFLKEESDRIEATRAEGKDFLMRVLRACLVVGIAMSSRVWSQNVSVTDYEVPVSRAERLIFDVAANHSTEGSSIKASNGNIGGIYKRFYDSLPFGYSIDANGSAKAERDVQRGEYETLYNISLSGNVKRYIWGESRTFLSDLFGSARFDGSMQKGYDQPASSVTIALGYGRFINATALAKAVRIERFLLDEGEITGHMPKESMIELGNIIEREAEYQEKFGDVIYKKEWFKDMEEVIRRSGMLKTESLGAIGILRMDEVLTRERIADRFYGWDVAVGSKFDVTLAESEKELPPANLDVSIDYARPVSWAWQFNMRLNGSSPFDNLGKEFTGRATADLTYELTNRVDFRTRYGLTWVKEEGRDSQMSHSAGVSFIYYLENQLNLVASEQIEKAPKKDLTTNFTLTLNYRVF